MEKLATQGKHSLKNPEYGTLAENGQDNSLDFTELREIYDDTVQKFTDLLQRIDPEITLKLLKKSHVPKKLSASIEECDGDFSGRPQKKITTKSTSKRSPSPSEESDENDVNLSKKASSREITKPTQITKSNKAQEDASMTDESDEDNDESETESIIERAAAPQVTQSAFAPVLFNIAKSTLLPTIADAANTYIHTPPQGNNPYKNVAPIMQGMMRYNAPQGYGYPGYYPQMQHYAGITPGAPPAYPQAPYYPYQEQRPFVPGENAVGYPQGTQPGYQEGYRQQTNQVPQEPRSPGRYPFQQTPPSVQGAPSDPQQTLEPLKQTTSSYQPPNSLETVLDSTKDANPTKPPLAQELIPGYQKGPQSSQVPPVQEIIPEQSQEQQPQPTQAELDAYSGKTPPGLHDPPKPPGNDPNSTEVAKNPFPTKSASPYPTRAEPGQTHHFPTQSQPLTDQRYPFIGQSQPFPGHEQHSLDKGHAFQNQAQPDEVQHPSSHTALYTRARSPTGRPPMYTKKKNTTADKKSTPVDINKLEGEVLQSLKDIDDQINVIINKLEAQ